MIWIINTKWPEYYNKNQNDFNIAVKSNKPAGKKKLEKKNQWHESSK